MSWKKERSNWNALTSRYENIIFVYRRNNKILATVYHTTIDDAKKWSWKTNSYSDKCFYDEPLMARTAAKEYLTSVGIIEIDKPLGDQQSIEIKEDLIIDKMPNNNLVKMCFGKKAYPQKTATDVINKVFRERHILLRLYICPICGACHLTKNN